MLRLRSAAGRGGDRLHKSPALPPPQMGGLGRDVLFCYDLELPPDFVPQPQARRCAAALPCPGCWVGRVQREGVALSPRGLLQSHTVPQASWCRGVRLCMCCSCGALCATPCVPHAVQDGEVSEFMRLPLERVAALVASPAEEFKVGRAACGLAGCCSCVRGKAVPQPQPFFPSQLDCMLLLLGGKLA